MKSIKALPGRCILRFPPPVEKIGRILISENSQVRPEFGEIYDIGEPLDDENRKIAYFLRDLQAKGKKIAVTFASGTGYFTDSQGNALDAVEWKWLKDYRSFRMSELAAFVDEGE